jgi:uncharacterized secreted protein with C-terminal beta-propeller domain
MDENDLPRHLDELASRGGEPRGAATVFAAAQASGGSVRSIAPRYFTPMVAIAAAVTLIAGVAAAGLISRGSGPSHISALPVETTNGQSSTTVAIPEVSVPAKLIAASRLVRFANCGAYLSYVRTKGVGVVTPYGLPGIGGGYGREAFSSGQALTATGPGPAADNKAAAPQAATAAGDAGGAAATSDFSTTNVQEAGIDEPDSVKTDGKRIFTLAGGTLYALAADSPRILGSLISNGASQFFLVGNRVVLFGGATNGGVEPMAASGVASDNVASTPGYYPYKPTTRITVIDVSNPAAMKEVSHLDVDGNFVSARLVDGVARIVISSTPSRLAFQVPADGTPAAQDAALVHNKDVVRKASYADWVPQMTVTDAAGKTSAARPITACDAAYSPPVFSGFGTLSVMSLDPTKPADAKSTSVVADGQTVYASASRLYVGTSQWGQVDPSGSVSPVQKTLVHAFDITDATQARYVESGEVRGVVLNQFSFSEDKGVLRVATTDTQMQTAKPVQSSEQPQNPSESFVTTLADQGGKALVQIGQVGGLGKGEQIHAVRFIGSLAYVVTFRQTDPLYVVDLSVPATPRVVGELKLLGFSAYLHPISDTLLLGVGQDANADGRQSGAAVSLFDISNPAAPKVLQHYSLGDTMTAAQFDHHAFLYWAATKLAVLPVQNYGPSGQGFTGAVGLSVTSANIHEVGRVSHPNGMIDRSLVIGSRLFTVSNVGVAATDMATFNQAAWVPFPATSQPSGGGGAPGSTPPAPAEPPSSSASSGASSGPTR